MDHGEIWTLSVSLSVSLSLLCSWNYDYHYSCRGPMKSPKVDNRYRLSISWPYGYKKDADRLPICKGRKHCMASRIITNIIKFRLLWARVSDSIEPKRCWILVSIKICHSLWKGDLMHRRNVWHRASHRRIKQFGWQPTPDDMTNWSLDWQKCYQ